MQTQTQTQTEAEARQGSLGRAYLLGRREAPRSRAALAYHGGAAWRCPYVAGSPEAHAYAQGYAAAAAEVTA